MWREFCEPPQIAGPGFINLKIKDDWLARNWRRLIADGDRLGVPQVAEPRTIVVDYSSPNVAKPMHVGHIRSTVIGDALISHSEVSRSSERSATTIWAIGARSSG